MQRSLQDSQRKILPQKVHQNHDISFKQPIIHDITILDVDNQSSENHRGNDKVWPNNSANFTDDDEEERPPANDEHDRLKLEDLEVNK